MARTRRVKSMAEGVARYHLVSRACNRQFLFRKARTKEKLVELVKKAAEFSGIEIEAFAVMDNHIHVLCTVVRTCEKIPEAEVVRRVRVLKGDRAADILADRCAELAAAGFDATLEAELDSYRSRMNDISGFMKTAKELFAIWFNHEFGYSGSVWNGVYKSTMVEGGEYFARCRRYIVLNPVRAGIVSQTKDYRWVWQRNTSETEVFPGCFPLATIIFEFLFCESAQGEDSKEKKGCGGKEEGRKNPFVNFGTKAPQALRHGSADCPWSIRCRGYGFLRGRPGFLLSWASRAAFFGSTAGLKSGYFAM